MYDHHAPKDTSFGVKFGDAVPIKIPPRFPELGEEPIPFSPQ